MQTVRRKEDVKRMATSLMHITFLKMVIQKAEKRRQVL